MVNKNKIEKIRERTYEEMCQLLDNRGRAAVIRPTGWGKTGVLTRLLKSGKYKHPLYIYPAEVIRAAVGRFYFNEEPSENWEIPGVEFMTNSKFARLKEEELLNIGYKHDIVIIDECHKLGGVMTSKNLDTLVDMFPDLVLLGATATPDRTDAVDVIGRYFGADRVFTYTIHDAFQDGFLQRPYYVYCPYAKPEDNIDTIGKEWRKNLDLIDNKRDQLTLADELRNREKEIANIYNMEKAIKRNCDKYIDTDYMKFIVFFSGFDVLHKEKDKVIGWFNKAYPDHAIKELVITSETKETAENVNQLKSLTYRKKGIDLIFAVDMLNMGYHVDSLTGIVMYRGTSSNIIYTQELGRALSSGTKKRAIVFDIMDNLHNQALYEVLGRESIYTKNARERREFLEKKSKEWDAFVKKHTVNVTTEDLRKASAKKYRLEKELEEKKKAGKSESVIMGIQKKLDEAATIEDLIKIKLMKLEEETKKFFEGKSLKEVEFTQKDQYEKNALDRRFDNSGNSAFEENAIRKEDLIVADEIADYRDLVRKLVAEPIARNANLAWQNYLESGGRYRDDNGNLFTSKQQFLNELPPEHIPLFPFCSVKRITVEDVMEYVLGFPREDDNKIHFIPDSVILPEGMAV